MAGQDLASLVATEWQQGLIAKMLLGSDEPSSSKAKTTRWQRTIAKLKTKELMAPGFIASLSSKTSDDRLAARQLFARWLA